MANANSILSLRISTAKGRVIPSMDKGRLGRLNLSPFYVDVLYGSALPADVT